MSGAGGANPLERLMVFAKAPVPGQAKTRLIPAVGPEGAARLRIQVSAGHKEADFDRLISELGSILK